MLDTTLLEHIHSSSLTVGEMVQACCTIAREQIEVGDYEAGCAALQRWWSIGEWPRQFGLEPQAAAELMLTAGTLSGWVASTGRVQGSQQLPEGLLNGGRRGSAP